MVHTSVTIAAPPQDVWDFITAPGSAFLTADGVRNSFRVPGTPVGLPGEQTCVVSEDSDCVSAEISEIVSLEPPKTLVARWVTSPSETVERMTLEEVANGWTSLTIQLAMRVTLGTSKKARPVLEQHLERVGGRIRAAIESGARLPSSPTD